MSELMNTPPTETVQEVVLSEEPEQGVPIVCTPEEVAARLSKMFEPNSRYLNWQKGRINSLINFGVIDSSIDAEDLLQNVVERLWKNMQHGKTFDTLARHDQDMEDAKDAVFYAYANQVVRKEIAMLYSKKQDDATNMAKSMSSKQPYVWPSPRYIDNLPPREYLNSLDPNINDDAADFTTLDRQDVERMYGVGYKEIDVNGYETNTRELVDLQARRDYKEICEELCVEHDVTYADGYLICFMKLDAYLRDLPNQGEIETNKTLRLYHVVFIHELADISPDVTAAILKINKGYVYTLRNRAHEWRNKYLSKKDLFLYFGQKLHDIPQVVPKGSESTEPN